MNREAMLHEMGITPLWKARGGAAAPLAQAVPVAAEPERQFAAPERATRPVAEVPSQQLRDAPAAKPAAVNIDPGRIEHIARMEWPELKETVAGCTACELCKSRKKTVFGVGDEQADWMIIGEAPGAEEDAKGEPFVGQAGRLLDSMLAALAMQRDTNLYIANVLKCRPPGNRNPEPLEVAQCAPHLLRQVALTKPKLIILMGRFASQTLLGTDASIASMRGRLHQYQGTPAIVTYHPAYLLRNLPDKAKAWQDLLFARNTYQRLQSGAAAAK
jgi:DNA polymerase